MHKLAFGFEHALTWQNLMFCAIGCTVGTLVGLLPGLGPLATISLLLPLTYSIPTGGALIMLAGTYYGAQYGDSVSAITMKIPHASSIVACIDGYQMRLNGKTRLALFTAGVSSFIGGTVAIVVLSFASCLSAGSERTLHERNDACERRVDHSGDGSIKPIANGQRLRPRYRCGVLRVLYPHHECVDLPHHDGLESPHWWQACDERSRRLRCSTSP